MVHYRATVCRVEKNIDKTINSNIGLKNYKKFFKLGVQNSEILLNIDKTIKL